MLDDSQPTTSKSKNENAFRQWLWETWSAKFLPEELDSIKKKKKFRGNYLSSVRSSIIVVITQKDFYVLVDVSNEPISTIKNDTLSSYPEHTKWQTLPPNTTTKK